MSDRFEELQDEFERAWYSEYESDTTPRISNALRWYHDKYLAEALTAATMMKVHEEKTCETCSDWKFAFKDRGYCQCAEAQAEGRTDVVCKTFGCIYHRRIVEVSK
jgi:hypothetical protein